MSAEITFVRSLVAFATDNVLMGVYPCALVLFTPAYCSVAGSK